MDFKDLIPHLSASLSLLEVQINEWDMEKRDSELLFSEKEELKSIRSVILEMRKTLNLFQLSNAKGNNVESYRLVKIFYGLLWMCRPSVQKINEILSDGRDYSSRISISNIDEYSLDDKNTH